MLVKLQILNFNANYAYAPPAEEQIVDLDDIRQISPIETRYSEPCSRIRLANGSHVVAVGSPADVLQTAAAIPPPPVARPRTRAAVYRAVDEERDYQDHSGRSIKERPHSVEEWITILADYCGHALTARPRASALQNLHQIRKIAAIAVAALEQHGAPSRTDEQAQSLADIALPDHMTGTTSLDSEEGIQWPHDPEND